MGRRTRVFRCGRGMRLLGEVGREALVEALDRDVDGRTQGLDEPLCLVHLLTAVAAHRQRQPDDDSLDVLRTNQLDHLREPVLGRRPLDDADRLGDRPGPVRDCYARPCRAVVQGEHLHSSAEASCRLPTSYASSRPSGFLPPASASVGRPPPPPPIFFAASRTTATASAPLATSERSRLTTRYARPLSTEPSKTASACFDWRIWAERSRSSAPFKASTCAMTTPPDSSRTVTSAVPAAAFFFESLRARSSSERSSSASLALPARWA